MRYVTFIFGLFAVMIWTGCSVTDQEGADVRDQLKRGVQGQGRIVPNDPNVDSFGSEYR